MWNKIQKKFNLSEKTVDMAERAFNTFWQGALTYFLLSFEGTMQAIINCKEDTFKVIIMPFVFGIIGAGLSAIKNKFFPRTK